MKSAFHTIGSEKGTVVSPLLSYMHVLSLPTTLRSRIIIMPFSRLRFFISFASFLFNGCKFTHFPRNTQTIRNFFSLYPFRLLFLSSFSLTFHFSLLFPLLHLPPSGDERHQLFLLFHAQSALHRRHCQHDVAPHHLRFLLHRRQLLVGAQSCVPAHRLDIGINHLWSLGIPSCHDLPNRPAPMFLVVGAEQLKSCPQSILSNWAKFGSVEGFTSPCQLIFSLLIIFSGLLFRIPLACFIIKMLNVQSYKL